MTGAELKARRESLGLSQAALATRHIVAAMSEAGVSRLVLMGAAGVGNSVAAGALGLGRWLHWLLPTVGLGGRTRLTSAVWCTAIAYSTMATKQHVALDVAAGAALDYETVRSLAAPSVPLVPLLAEPSPDLRQYDALLTEGAA